jgi:hypothetical protein
MLAQMFSAPPTMSFSSSIDHRDPLFFFRSGDLACLYFRDGANPKVGCMATVLPAMGQRQPTAQLPINSGNQARPPLSAAAEVKTVDRVGIEV